MAILNVPSAPPPTVTLWNYPTLAHVLAAKLKDPARQASLIQSRGVLLGVFDLDAQVRTLENRLRAAFAALPPPLGPAIERRALRPALAGLAHVRRLAEHLNALPPRQLTRVFRTADAHLREAISWAEDAKPTARVLLAFSLVEDQSLTLYPDPAGGPAAQLELEALVEAATQGSTAQLDEALQRAIGGRNLKAADLNAALEDELDVLAAVLSLRNFDGQKPLAQGRAQEFLIEHFGKRGGAVDATYGGGAGNEATVHSAFRLPLAVHAPYNHPAQALLAGTLCAGTAPKSDLKWLRFGNSGPNWDGDLASTSELDHPRRQSFVLQITPNAEAQRPSLLIGATDWTWDRADRVIPRVPHPRSASPHDCNKLQVRWFNGSKWETTTVPWGGVDEQDWPQLPVFQDTPSPSAQRESRTLRVELASAQDMRPVAKRYPLVLLGGVQSLAKKSLYKSSRPPALGVQDPQRLTELLRRAFIAQVNALVEGGATVRVEISGVETASELAELARVLKAAGIREIGLNREELVLMTSLADTEFFWGTRPVGPESPLSIYQRAVKLLDAFKADVLYVHDIELDVLVRRKPKDESDSDTRNALSVQRRAMQLAKAAVPAMILGRAGADWDTWQAVPSSESLMALIAFAREYAELAAINLGLKNDVAGEVLTEFAHTMPRSDQDDHISVVVAPAVWVNLGQANLAGGGDMSFAVWAAACTSAVWA